MQSKPIYQYIYFGSSLRYLQDVRAGWVLRAPVDGQEWYVLEILNHFLSWVPLLNLTVTDRAATNLNLFRQELGSRPPNHVLTEEEAAKLKGLIDSLRPILDAEASGQVAFIVTDKRLQVTRLLSDVGALFAPGIVDALPATAKYDLAEAGKCVAFERPTAAAFHLLRATEGVLRHFYCSVVKRNRIDPLLWGPIITALRDRRKPPAASLLANLDNIRVSFRNPTQHPEKIYDIHEVQDLFGLCIEVINRMVTAPQWKSVRTPVPLSAQP